jgi:hypothetical protein
LKKNLEQIGPIESGEPILASASTHQIKEDFSTTKTAGKSTPRAFVIMPFAERDITRRSEGFFKEVYSSIIKPACDSAGFFATTADRKGSDIIHTTILKEILEADIVVADLTDHNPNVMFELGLRMAIAKKPVCIIKTKDTGRVIRRRQRSPGL